MQEFYTEGLQFECSQCSRCCRIEPGFVYLSESDLTKLCQWFSLTRQLFITKYCRWVPYYDGSEVLCLSEKPGYDCILWQNGCTAYDARPVQCRTFPFWSRNLQCRASWIEAAKDCPGINNGKLYSAEEITTQKELYDAVEPVHRPAAEGEQSK